MADAQDADSASRAVAAVARLDEITRRLRRECPWDREQDERSIVPHTVEEAYELADAARSGDDDKLLDELGDVLFQVHFLALLLEERGSGDLAAVAAGTAEKLIRRHPHVYGESEAGDSGEVLANWDRIKREKEGRQAEWPFADVPENLPGPLYARKLLRRACSSGLPGPAEDVEAATRAVGERAGSLTEVRLEGGPQADPDVRHEADEAIGELMLAVVDLARVAKVDPELALRGAAERMRARAEPGSI